MLKIILELRVLNKFLVDFPRDLYTFDFTRQLVDKK